MAINSANAITSAISYRVANSVINSGLADALDTMDGMIGNAGQQTVYNSYVIDAFKDARGSAGPGDSWPGVDIGEYMDFMGIIVEEGNNIMEEAYEEAAEILNEEPEESEDFEEDEGFEE